MFGEHRHRPQDPARRPVLAPAGAGLGLERAPERAFGDADRRTHGRFVDVGEMFLRVPHDRGDDGYRAGREPQRRFGGVEPLGGEQRERGEEGVGGGVARRPVDAPPRRVDDHLAHRRGRRQHADAVVVSRHHRRLEEHRHRPDLAQRRLVGEPGRDPRRLLGREEVARAVGLDLGDALERVQELVQLVRVPDRDESSASSGHAPARTGDPARIATGMAATGTASSLAAEAATPTTRTVTVSA